METFILDKNIYNLNDEEIFSFSEAKKFLEQNKNLYVLHELYNAFYINILKRIEYFGTSDVLEFLNKADLYKNEEISIIKRWNNFEELEIFSSLETLEIINTISYNLILSFYSFKKNSSLDKVINTEEIVSFFNLLKNELLLQKYALGKIPKYESKKRESDNKEKNRRKEDNIKNEKKQEITIRTDTAKKLLILEQNHSKEENKQSTQIYI